MRLNTLATLRELEELNTLERESKPIKSKYYSSVDILCYSVDLCSVAMKILRGEILVKDKDLVIDALIQETKKTQHPDFIYELYTDAKAKKFYKSIGIKPQHLKQT